MMVPGLLVLDTNILVALIRGGPLGQRVDAKYGLTTMRFRPVISIVTKAELLTLADLWAWGTKKRQAVENTLSNLVIEMVDSQQIVDAYVEIEHAARTVPSGAVTLGKNDIWIAATALVTKARLLSTDKDFLPLTGKIKIDWIDPDLEDVH